MRMLDWANGRIAGERRVDVNPGHWAVRFFTDVDEFIRAALSSKCLLVIGIGVWCSFNVGEDVNQRIDA